MRRRRSRSLGAIIRRAVTVQTLVVALVIGLALAGFFLERSVAATERKDQDILLNLESFEFQVLNAETGFRGYALAQKQPFLDPYRQAFPAIASLRPVLTRLVDRQDTPRLINAFRGIYQWRRNFAQPSLHLFRVGRGDSAHRLIDSGEGKRRIDRIRNDVGVMRAHARANLKKTANDRQKIGIALLGTLLLALVGSILGGLRAATVLRRAISAPIGRLVAATGKIRSGDLSARAPVQGAAELRFVAESFNAMATEVEKVVAGLREVDDLKTRFLSTVSHELRTPLTSITGYLQLLEQGVMGELTPDQLNYVHVAQRNGDRLTSLIDDLLMLSRFDAGRIEMACERVDVAEQLRHLREEMVPVAAKRQTQLALETPSKLIIEGDSRRLSQSFANLVSNAIKFNREGGEVHIAARSRNGGAVVEVRDQGVGIPPEELERIGERFFRASTTTNMPGTGLGLAITREIVERHGGKLEIESEVGRGSIFRIQLPRTQAAAES
jgi:two-component system OmpR family sensor kinase